MLNKYQNWIQNNDSWKMRAVLYAMIMFVVVKSYILADIVFMKTISTVLNVLTGESITNSLIKEFGNTGLKALELLLLRHGLAMKIYGTIVMFICSMMSFYCFNRVLGLLGLKINPKCNLFKQAKLIFCWIGSYSACNLIIYSFGFSDEVYVLLATGSQCLLLFCMMSMGACDYEIKAK